jgi:hypothetical protein
LTLVFVNIFNLGCIFWMVCTRTLIFHVNITCDKTLPWVQIFFDLVTLTLVFNLLIGNFSLGYIFWMVGTMALTFHINIPCNKTFPWVPKNWLCDQKNWHCDLDLGVWPNY